MKKRLALIFLYLLSATLLRAADYRFAVIPVEFSDVTFSNTSDGINAKLTTAKEYFESQFSSSRTFTFEVLQTVTLPYPRSRYGTNYYSSKDSGIEEAVRVACIQSRADFSPYDNDDDGVIDCVCIITAGESEADGGGADSIWPRQGYLSESGLTVPLGNKILDCYLVCPEKSSPKVFCHEFAHYLGLQDMYDTDGALSGGTSKGLWNTLSIMDDGSGLPNFNAVELEQLGLGECLAPAEGRFILHPLSKRKEYLRLETDNPGEYFLMECRDRNGWDSCLPGGGLVIYHVDRSQGNAWFSDMYRRNLSAAERWKYNQVNCRPEHQCVMVVEAVPGTNDVTKIFFPQADHTTFGSETDPAFRFWSGTTCDVAIDAITREADGRISFNIVTPLNISTCDVFQDAAIITWKCPQGLIVRDCVVSWHPSEGSIPPSSFTVFPDKDGICSARIEGLTPQTEYQATIRAVCPNGMIFSKTLEFKTRMAEQGAYPFIYLNSVERSPEGRFTVGSKLPLRVYNTVGAAAVAWYFNGMRIYPGTDGFWTLPAAGELRAEVRYPDGSTEIISKKISVE